MREAQRRAHPQTSTHKRRPRARPRGCHPPWDTHNTAPHSHKPSAPNVAPQARTPLSLKSHAPALYASNAPSCAGRAPRQIGGRWACGRVVVSLWLCPDCSCMHARSCMPSSLSAPHASSSPGRGLMHGVPLERGRQSLRVAPTRQGVYYSSPPPGWLILRDGDKSTLRLATPRHAPTLPLPSRRTRRAPSAVSRNAVQRSRPTGRKPLRQGSQGRTSSLSSPWPCRASRWP
jgi:hypothetical protein